MLVHTLIPQDLSSGTNFWFHVWRESIFYCSSSLFAFVAGYLAWIVEIRKFSQYVISDFCQQYFYKKIKNVYCPMLVVSSIICGIYFFTGTNYFYNAPPLPDDVALWIRFFFLGGVQGQFWYIPFTLICFLFVPLLFMVSRKGIAIVTVIALFVPFFIARESTYIWKDPEGTMYLFKLLSYHGPFFHLRYLLC